jgi:O-antigen/teichoic acid export membrane protein
MNDALPRAELRRRASAGVAITASWGLLNLVVGFGGNLVLARMLLPREFGLVAIGMTITVFATAVAEGGLASGLIRRPQTPGRAELGAVLGLQLALTTGLAVATALAASPFGEAGAIVAVMVAALPLSALQTPGRAVLGRELLLRPIAVVDAAALVAYYAWAIGGVLAGYGVWALATASVVRAATGSVAMLRLSGLGLVRPTLRGSGELRPLVSFGLRFQAVSLTTVLRDQGLNVATGLVGGVAMLGLWSFASRLMQVPLLLFESLWRVSFPAMSQLLAADEDPKPAIERGVALASIAAGTMLTACAGASPQLVPVLFGEQWRAAADIVPLACLALLIAGPVSVATVGYLYAAGDPASVLRASLRFAVVWLAVGIPLLPVLGLPGLGIGWAAGAAADACTLARATRARSGARVAAHAAVPLALAVASGGAGWALAAVGPQNLLGALQGGGAALALYLAALSVFRRELLLETLGAALRSLRSALPGPAAPEPGA